MHNLKELRKDLETFKKKFKHRNIDFDIIEFNKLDKDNRDLINKKELLEQEKKSLSKLIKRSSTGLTYLGKKLINKTAL